MSTFKANPAHDAYIHQNMADVQARFKQYCERAGLTEQEGHTKVAQAWGSDQNQVAVDALIDPFVDDQYKSSTLEYKKQLFMHQHYGYPMPVLVEAVTLATAEEVPQPVEPTIVEEDQPVTYPFADTLDGELFTITTPELGTVEVVATRQTLCGKPPVVGLHFGHIKTPLACLGPDGQTNAHLQFYSSGTGYYSLRMVYTCRCAFENHNHALEWFDLAIDGRAMKSDAIGDWLRSPHNHPLVEQFAHLAPSIVTKSVTKSVAKSVTKPEAIPFKNIPRAEPKPAKEVSVVDDPKVNSKGQFTLF